jgi:aspartate/methionine/tyrosine aminotransferase
MRRLNGLFTSSMSHPAERFAARALDHAEMVLTMQRRRVDRNRAIVNQFVASQPKLSWVQPEAGTVGFVRVAGGDVDGLVRRLLADDTLVTPGRFFGVDDHFRIGFGMEQPHLEEGLRRLARGLAG